MARVITSDRPTPKRTGTERRPWARSNSGPGRRRARRTRRPTIRWPARGATAPSRRGRRPPATRQQVRRPWRGRGTPASTSYTASPASTRTRSRARAATAPGRADSARPAASTKIPDQATTHTMACDLEIAPRGISRPAVRGFRASHHASTTRLNPIAALRALTMATTIHTTCRKPTGVMREASSAPGERKRQREHRVAEPDERSPRVYSCEHGVTRLQATCRADCRHRRARGTIQPHRS